MKLYIYASPLLVFFCNLSVAQEVTCSSPEVLEAINKKLHDFALIRNTKLSPQSILDVPVGFSHISDSVARDGWLTCWAYSSIRVDKSIAELLANEDLKYSKSASEAATNYISGSYNQPGDESQEMLTFKGVHYNVYISDGGGLKNVELDANDRVSYAIYGVAWFQQNIDNVKSEIIQNAYIDAYRDFTRKDRYINDIYNNFPALIQKGLKSDMRKWIKEKNAKCGKVESLPEKDILTAEKTKVYRCQAEMTQKQIGILTE